MGKNNGNKQSSADDDWEHMIDNGSLDRAVEKLSMKSNVKTGSAHAERASNEPPNAQVQVRLEEPSTRTTFTPMVRILKRETAPVKIAMNNELRSNNANEAPVKKNSATTKTFAQRADEYARARARIMGTQSGPAVPNGGLRNALLDSSNDRHQDFQPQQFYRDRRVNGR